MATVNSAVAVCGFAEDIWLELPVRSSQYVLAGLFQPRNPHVQSCGSDSEGHATSALADMFPVSGQCPISGEQPELPASLGEGRVG